VPDIIIGDMDSASDAALRAAKERVVHAYVNGSAPGLARLRRMGLHAHVLEAFGTSEDIALMLAYDMGADIIVAVGTHLGLVEFLDKGRPGMASTFLCRLKVGDRLMDAKGVSKLYRASVKPRHLAALIFAGCITAGTIVSLSPWVQRLIRLLGIKLDVLLQSIARALGY
ncbi:MAG: putative cytokinetic ring protein SteA, partial [Armatimonadota bacterium]